MILFIHLLPNNPKCRNSFFFLTIFCSIKLRKENKVKPSIITSPMLSSQGIVLATAMAVSAGTIILFDLFKEKCFPPSQNPRSQNFRTSGKQVLKSCLASSGSKRRAVKNKRVQFADDVKDSKKNGEMYRKEQRKLAEIQKTSCGKYEMIEIQKMPANRAALYSGILKDRVQRLEYSY